VRITVFLQGDVTSRVERGVCGTRTRTYMCTGGQYTGEWKNGLRHGHGMLEIPQGVKYDGDWENDKMHGQGILILANGTKFVLRYLVLHPPSQ